MTDAALPDAIGIDLAEEAEERGIPVIMMTSYAFRFGNALSRYEVLLKPVRPAELLDAIENVLRRVSR